MGDPRNQIYSVPYCGCGGNNLLSEHTIIFFRISGGESSINDDVANKTRLERVEQVLEEYISSTILSHCFVVAGNEVQAGDVGRSGTLVYLCCSKCSIKNANSKVIQVATS